MFLSFGADKVKLHFVTNFFCKNVHFYNRRKYFLLYSSKKKKKKETGNIPKSDIVIEKDKKNPLQIGLFESVDNHHQVIQRNKIFISGNSSGNVSYNVMQIENVG